jgi:DNA-directed RNA polymerase subunit RPC12/RpoP
MLQGKLVTLLIKQAARAEGSTQALATRLNAPEPTLLRWMTGQAQVPLRVFLAVLDYLMELERRDGDRADWAGDAGGSPDKVVLTIGTLPARCPRCGEPEFRRLLPGTFRLTSELACARCGAQVVHGSLLAQLAKDAVKQSRAVAARTQSRLRSAR